MTTQILTIIFLSGVAITVFGVLPYYIYRRLEDFHGSNLPYIPSEADLKRGREIDDRHSYYKFLEEGGLLYMDDGKIFFHGDIEKNQVCEFQLSDPYNLASHILTRETNFETLIAELGTSSAATG